MMSMRSHTHHTACRCTPSLFPTRTAGQQRGHPCTPHTACRISIADAFPLSSPLALQGSSGAEGNECSCTPPPPAMRGSSIQPNSRAHPGPISYHAIPFLSPPSTHTLGQKSLVLLPLRQQQQKMEVKGHERKISDLPTIKRTTASCWNGRNGGDGGNGGRGVGGGEDTRKAGCRDGWRTY